MSGDSGKAEITSDMHYEEHRGTKADLLFGQELSFVAGSEMSVMLGLESSFGLGPENKIGLGTNTNIELGAEVSYVKGIAVELAKEGGGGYEEAFSVTAGAESLGAFTRLSVFVWISLGVQATAIASMLTATKTHFVPGGNRTLAPEGETGAKITIGICQNIAGVMMFLGTIILNKVIKSIHQKPLTAVTVNHSSQAFIGVRGKILDAGAAGLELTTKLFNLTASDKSRDFRLSGHEVVGYVEKNAKNPQALAPDTFVKGTEKDLTLYSPDIKIQTDAGGDSAFIGLNDSRLKLEHNRGGNVSSLFMGEWKSLPPGILVPTDTWVTRISGGKDKANSILNLAEGWTRLAAKDGSKLEIEASKKVKLTYAGASSEVELSQTGLELKFGGNNITMNNTGVKICGSAFQILSPNVAIPDLLSQSQRKIEIMEIYASDMKQKVEDMVKEKITQTKRGVHYYIKNVQRTVESKVSEALAKTGA